MEKLERKSSASSLASAFSTISLSNITRRRGTGVGSGTGSKNARVLPPAVTTKDSPDSTSSSSSVTPTRWPLFTSCTSVESQGEGEEVGDSKGVGVEDSKGVGVEVEDSKSSTAIPKHRPKHHEHGHGQGHKHSHSHSHGRNHGSSHGLYHDTSSHSHGHGHGHGHGHDPNHKAKGTVQSTNDTVSTTDIYTSPDLATQLQHYVDELEEVVDELHENRKGGKKQIPPISAYPVAIGVLHDGRKVDKASKSQQGVKGKRERERERTVKVVSCTATEGSVSVTASAKANVVTVNASVVTTPTSNRNRQLVSKYVIMFAEYFPANSKARENCLKCEPIISSLAELLYVILMILSVTIEIIWIIGSHMWTVLQPYQPALLAPSFLGLIMCFFGGSFMALIGAVEAYRVCGYETTVISINQLISDFKKVKEANDKDDDAVDVDNTGASDVVSLSSGREMLQRKAALFLRTVDPSRLINACVGINMGFIAVVATLKLKFAKTLTLGNALSCALEGPAKEHVLPMIELLVPDDMQKWAAFTLTYCIKSFCISLAWYLQRFVSSYHSAIIGGVMFSTNIFSYLNYIGVINEKSVKDKRLISFIGYAVALLGIYFQLAYGFRLPFPLNIVLLPFTFLEYFLVGTVNYVTHSIII